MSTLSFKEAEEVRYEALREERRLFEESARAYHVLADSCPCGYLTAKNCRYGSEDRMVWLTPEHSHKTGMDLIACEKYSIEMSYVDIWIQGRPCPKCGTLVGYMNKNQPAIFPELTLEPSKIGGFGILREPEPIDPEDFEWDDDLDDTVQRDTGSRKPLEEGTRTGVKRV